MHLPGSTHKACTIRSIMQEVANCSSVAVQQLTCHLGLSSIGRPSHIPAKEALHHSSLAHTCLMQ